METMTEKNDQPHNWLEELQQDPDVFKIQEIAPGIHFCRFTDYTAMLYDAQGKSIKCPLLDYDAVVGCKAFGNIDGKEYFIVKAFQWCIETKMDFIVFDIDGKQKAMREIIGKPKYRIDDLLRDEKDSLIRDIREVEREQRKLSESDRGNRPGRHF